MVYLKQKVAKQQIFTSHSRTSSADRQLYSELQRSAVSVYATLLY